MSTYHFSAVLNTDPAAGMTLAGFGYAPMPPEDYRGPIGDQFVGYSGVSTGGATTRTVIDSSNAAGGIPIWDFSYVDSTDSGASDYPITVLIWFRVLLPANITGEFTVYGKVESKLDAVLGRVGNGTGHTSLSYVGERVEVTMQARIEAVEPGEYAFTFNFAGNGDPEPPTEFWAALHGAREVL